MSTRQLADTDLHVVPVLVGDGIRLLDDPGGAPVRLEPVNGAPSGQVNVRCRPIR